MRPEALDTYSAATPDCVLHYYNYRNLFLTLLLLLSLINIVDLYLLFTVLLGNVSSSSVVPVRFVSFTVG